MKTTLPMAFSSVPSESKSQINKAGKFLSRDNYHFEELAWAVDLTNRWRACHAYPINTFQSTLRNRLKMKRYEDYIVAQRLKRLPTIIDKLKRHPNMQLTTMQDIGGIRAILNTVSDVRKLKAEYSNNPHFIPMIVDMKDYIENPRDEDGYRSSHLIFRYQNSQNSNYDGLKLEMQIRTKLQHAWATAVETMGTFLGDALKSRQGDKKWLDFFAITSSAFAYIEGCKPVPRFEFLSRRETFEIVTETEQELGVMEKMLGFSVALNQIYSERGKGSSYYLIILDSLNRNVRLVSYNRDSIDKAMQDYADIEKEVTQGRKVEPVLVASGSIESLRRAYPNFFLDTSEFTNALRSIFIQTKKPK